MEEITKTVENMQIKPTQVHLPTCRICLKPFERKFNGPKECIYHPESFTGETAQRWMDPGETKGGSELILILIFIISFITYLPVKHQT